MMDTPWGIQWGIQRETKGAERKQAGESWQDSQAQPHWDIHKEMEPRSLQFSNKRRVSKPNGLILGDHVTEFAGSRALKPQCSNVRNRRTTPVICAIASGFNYMLHVIDFCDRVLSTKGERNPYIPSRL